MLQAHRMMLDELQIEKDPTAVVCENDHSWTRGFTGTPSPNEKIPPKASNQSKTNTADSHLNRLETAKTKRGLTTEPPHTSPGQRLRPVVILSQTCVKQPNQEVSLQ